MTRISPALLGSLVALLLGALISPLAGAEPGFSSVVRVPLPTGLTSATLSIACVSAGNCTAIGRAGDEPFVVTQTSGAWGTPQLLDGFMTGVADVNGPMRIACPAANACVAVGGEQSGGVGLGSTPVVEFPYVVTESGGAWGTIAFVAPPSDANTSTPSAAFTSVWCASPGNCVALGPYTTSTDTTRAMEAIETNGIWGTTTSLPGTESFGTAVYLSCSSPGNCSAVSDEAAWTETAGVWGDPTAFGQTSSPQVAFQPADLGCTTTGSCVAVGAMVTEGDANDLAASDVETAGTWGTATSLPLPELSAVETQSALSSISCGTSACVAVGSGGHHGVIYSYLDPIAATWSDGTWSSIGIDQVGPINEDDYSAFDSVSCPEATACEAVGQRATWTLPGGLTDSSQFDTDVAPAEAVGTPGPPARVVAYAGLRSVLLTWTPPTEDGGAPITSYTATLSPGGTTCTNTGPFCAFYGLTNGRQYVALVRDSNGTATSTQATLSNHVFAGAVPSTPAHLHAVLARNGEFAWSGSTTPKGEPVLRYEISAIGGGHTYHCMSAHTSCIVGTLPTGTYTVTVDARDATGWSGPSATLVVGSTRAT